MPLLDGNLEIWAIYASIGYGILLLLLLIQWTISLGFVRGILSWLCRAGWTLPLLTTVFPRTELEALPRSMTLKPIRVLLDDSTSMKAHERTTPAYLDQGKTVISALEKECLRIGCTLKTTFLSELDPTVKLGFTSLNSHIDSWILRNPQDPWILVTDGADSLPTEPWKPTLKGVGKSLSQKEKTPRGLIIGFEGQQKPNIWIKSPKIAPFSFENKQLNVKLIVGRSTTQSEEIVQIQVGVAPQTPTTINVKFKPQEDEVLVNTVLAPLPKGQHLIEMRALPTANEETIWDNTTFSQIEVLPNTFGVLHLLGSPSWDGRFLRRYLKGEPKYDLISFFILRDPWDSQQVNERELSLIPFPVERLFQEELPNFRVVIIQNFTLFQFLLPEYQANLVKFVQDGGGLLFIGGPRALHAADIMGSPLKAILPFEIDDKMGHNASPYEPDAFELDQDMMPFQPTNTPSSVAYDPELSFKIELAKPEAKKRSLANVYDDWENLESSLTGWTGAKGIHRMDRARFKELESTILLHATTIDPNTKSKLKIPLAVASYPGKGRALWIFSDSLWRLGMTMNQDISRQIYSQFMHHSMTWLMRQDLKKPLILHSIGFSSRPGEFPKFHASLQGPSVRYFETNNDWVLKVCGLVIPNDRLLAHRQSDNEIELSGTLPANIASGKLCEFSIEGNHPAFGSVKTSITAVFPETFRDNLLQPVPHKLEDLASLAEANLLIVQQSSPPPGSQKSKNVEIETFSKIQYDTLEASTTSALNWLIAMTGSEGISLPTKFRSLKEYYWIFNSYWIYAILLLIPAEILVRRWNEIVAKPAIK